MGGLSLADIAKWDPVAIGEVAQTAQKLAVAVEEAAQPLTNMPVFATWTGTAASSAQWAMRDSVEKAERFVGATRILGGAATVAQGAVEGLTRTLTGIHLEASAHGLRINDAANSVEIAVSTAHWSDEDFAQLKANQRELQAQVDTLVATANRVDDELAHALAKISDDGKKSVWAINANDVNSFVVGALASAKTDLLSEFGERALAEVDGSLAPWLAKIGTVGVKRVGVVGNIAMMIPSIIADVGQGDKLHVAVAKEAGGVAAGIAAGAATGVALGTFAPGVGNVAGAVIGAIVGGGVSVFATKGIGEVLQ